ncbi:hypothetical protein PM082_004952 [Marasmius tenuissimus]|nr:hypothetical protein PM082_004952 [Marasmius tenuissimus]
MTGDAYPVVDKRALNSSFYPPLSLLHSPSRHSHGELALMTSDSQDFASDEPQPGRRMPPAATAWTYPCVNNPSAGVGDMREVPSRSRHCRLQIGDRNDPAFDHNTIPAAPNSDYLTTDLMIAMNEPQTQSAVDHPRDDSSGTDSLLSELAHGTGTHNSSSSATPPSYGDRQRTHLFTNVSSYSLDGYSDSNGYDHGERLASSGQIPHGGSTHFAANLGFNNSASSFRQVGSSALTKSSTARRGPRPPRYFCEVPWCSSRGFTAKHNYDYHIRAHRGEKPFECTECGTSFCSRNDLRRHRSQGRKRRCRRPGQMALPA